MEQRPVHRRPRADEHRQRRVNLRLSDTEHRDLAAAAALTAETTAGYSARVALAVARGHGDVGADELTELRALLSELMIAHNRVNKVGVLLNQAVAALHSTGAAPAWLRRVVELLDARTREQYELEHRLGTHLDQRVRRRRTRPAPHASTPNPVL